MDVQMPEMDGFEATALIREVEKTSGAHLPIIALTAHALEGDRKRCLEAGMDAYLSKPLQAEELGAAIEAALAPAAAKAPELDLEPERAAAAAGASATGFEHEEALARMGGNLELFREVADMLAADSPRFMAELRAAARACDGLRLYAAAHSLRGALGYVGARVPVQKALELERSGKTGDFELANRQAVDLAAELARLGSSLALFIEARGNSPCSEGVAPL